MFHSWKAPYELTSVQAGEVEAVHRKTTEMVYKQHLVPVEGQTDIVTMGLPYLSPYNVNSIMNPILVAVQGLGYFFNLYRNKPVVREGGVLIMSHPTTGVPPGAPPQLHRLLRAGAGRDHRPGRDAAQVRKAVRRRRVVSPPLSHQLRLPRGPPVLHVVLVLPMPSNTSARSSWSEVTGAVRRLGFRPASTLQDALEMAEDTVGPKPHHAPPQSTHPHGRRSLGDVRGLAPVHHRNSHRTEGCQKRREPVQPASGTTPPGPGDRWPRPCQVGVYGFMKPAVRIYAKPKVIGADRLDAVDGPVILAANHHSHADTSLMLATLPGHLRRDLAVVAGADYFFPQPDRRCGPALFIGAIPIERTKLSKLSIENAVNVIQTGHNLLIYPEGGRQPTAGAVSTGPGRLVAKQTGAPVIPVYIDGTATVLLKGQNWPTRRTAVVFGKELRMETGEDARAFAARIQAKINELAGRVRPRVVRNPASGRTPTRSNRCRVPRPVPGVAAGRLVPSPRNGHERRPSAGPSGEPRPPALNRCSPSRSNR
ncbi:MAG: lysophospholipid acyltransferase family protein [Acidimicrobiales bacterium]